MNRLLIFSNEQTENDQFLIEDELRVHHISQVLKLTVNDKLKATLLDSKLLIVSIIELTQKHVRLQKISEENARKQWGDLIIGASRPPTLKKVFEHGTSLGVNSFHIIKAKLSEKSYLESKLLKNEEYSKYLHLGISQSAVYAHAPKVEVTNYFPQALSPTTKQKFILSPYAKNNILDYEFDTRSPLSLAIGPERGWTDKELDNFQSLNVIPVSLSPSILRVEIATFSALGILNCLMDNSQKSI